MDEVIANIAREDGDLLLCTEAGVAYQRQLDHLVAYDETYFNKCASYEDQAIAIAINRGRIELVAKHYSPIARVVDIGIGSGEFIKKRPNTWGRDVNPVAEAWLRDRRLWAEDLQQFQAFTFWDVIEHVPRPAEYFAAVPARGYLFTSMPIFADLARIRESKHYRPDEHIYYWTEPGFIRWMARHGFDLLERQTFEIEAGRDSIYSYAFQKGG